MAKDVTTIRISTELREKLKELGKKDGLMFFRKHK